MALRARVWYQAGNPKREATDTVTGSTKASDTSKQIQHRPAVEIVVEAEVVVEVHIAAVEAVAQGLALAPLREEAVETLVLCLDQHLDQLPSLHPSQLQHHQAQLALRAPVGVLLHHQVNQVAKQAMNQYGLTMTKTHVNLARVARELLALVDQWLVDQAQEGQARPVIR